MTDDEFLVQSDNRLEEQIANERKLDAWFSEYYTSRVGINPFVRKPGTSYWGMLYGRMNP